MAFPGKTLPKVPFFKDSGRCPKILDYTLDQAAQSSIAFAELQLELSQPTFLGFPDVLQEI